ncbi:MAG: DUF4271 domain-containing protein [Porphyromonas sp.]|nr:DUF4271 domain-containing protein [Porphyromonas sp.]
MTSSNTLLSTSVDFPVFPLQFKGEYPAPPGYDSTFFVLSLVFLLLLFAVMYAIHPNYSPGGLKAALRLKPIDALGENMYGFSFGMKFFLGLQGFLLASFILFLLVESGLPKQLFSNSQYLLISAAAVSIFIAVHWVFRTVIGSIFMTPEAKRLWQFQEFILFTIWGMLLYLPFALFLSWSENKSVAIWLSLGLFLVYRVASFYKSWKLIEFNPRYSLHLILYLCALEILPFLAVRQFIGSMSV